MSKKEPAGLKFIKNEDGVIAWDLECGSKLFRGPDHLPGPAARAA